MSNEAEQPQPISVQYTAEFKRNIRLDYEVELQATAAESTETPAPDSTAGSEP